MASFIRIVGFVLLPVSVVMVLGGYVYHVKGEQQARQAADRQLLAAAELAAQLIERRIQGIDGSLQSILLQEPLHNYFMFAINDLGDEAEDDRLLIEQALQRMAVVDPRVRRVELYSPEGVRFVAVLDGKRTVARDNVRGQAWFAAALGLSRSATFEPSGRLRLTCIQTDAFGQRMAVARLIYDFRDAFADAARFATRHLDDIEVTVQGQEGRGLFYVGSLEDDENGDRVFEKSALVRPLAVTVTVRQSAWAALKTFYLSEMTLFIALGVGLLVISAFGAHLALASLRDAKRKSDEANLAKSKFLANMSHEIRTPMNGVLGMLQLLRNTELTWQQREYETLARGSAESLLRILNDILDFSKIEAGKLALDHAPFRLREVVGDTLQTLAVPAAEKKLELILLVEHQVPEHVVGDAGRLSQVLINLVGNAIKFTAQGEVSVTVARDPADAGPDETGGEAGPVVRLRFSVRDTGIGIPPDKQRLIFEAFSQADASTTRRFGGTGLGLAISSQLVQMMNGGLDLSSQPGQGSTFEFTVALEMQEGASDAPPVNIASLRGLPVLIVDDTSTNRVVLKDMLLHFGLDVTAVAGGRAALERLEQAVSEGRPFRLVLSDMMMPEMDGLELAERIRRSSQEAVSGVRLIVLSSAGQPPEEALCAKLGIARSLAKPVKQSDLLSAIAATMQGSEALRSTILPSPCSTTSPPKRILLAEDGYVNQKVAVNLLQHRGHLVTVVENGQLAVEAAANGRFDLILMDVEMPEMDGLEATAAIRAQEQGSDRHVPIVAMTAHAVKGDRERFLERGMDGYLAKPVDAEDLYRVVDRFPANHDRVEGESASVVDVEAALQRTGGNGELVAELAQTFH